jgi:hypothetical protein
MRAAVLILASVLAASALAGCSPRHEPPTPPAPPAEPAAPAAPAPPTEPAPPEPAPFPPTPPEPPTPPAPPPRGDAVVRFSPSDYGAWERRLAALINNAESRDTSGETQYIAEQGRAQRARCTTKACVEQSYAAEEARLRKWEGSADIK